MKKLAYWILVLPLLTTAAVAFLGIVITISEGLSKIYKVIIDYFLSMM